MRSTLYICLIYLISFLGVNSSLFGAKLIHKRKPIPKIGQRVYIPIDSGGVEIISDKAFNSSRQFKYFRDPMFDQHHFEELLAQEKAAMIERSKLQDKDSIINLGELHIRGRAANPRVRFERNALPAQYSVDELPPINTLDSFPSIEGW